MLDFDAVGLAALRRDLLAAGNIPTNIQKNMVDEQAKVVEKAIVYEAGTMLQGPYYEGAVARSVSRKKPTVSKKGASEIITFKGEQHGNRLGEIAFVNEFGKKSQPARPFIKTAIKDAENPAAEAAREVLDQYLKNKNL